MSDLRVSSGGFLILKVNPKGYEVYENISQKLKETDGYAFNIKEFRIYLKHETK